MHGQEEAPDAGRRQVTRRRFLELAATVPLLGAAACVSDGGSDPATRAAKRIDSKAAKRSVDAVELAPPLTSTPQARVGQPITVVVPPAAETGPGYVFLTPTKSKRYQHGPLIVEQSGEPVWFLPLDTGATNLQVQQYRGEPVLTWWQGERVLPGYGRGHYVICDSSYHRIATVHAGNGLKGDLHEFVLTPQGTALFTAYQASRADLSSLGGARHGTLLDSFMQEVDVASGKVLFQWNAAQHVPLHLSFDRPRKNPSSPWDYFHINSICVDTDGNYVISSRCTWAVYKIDRSTGDVIWQLNGKKSDFRMGPKTHFYWQHFARTHPGGLLTLFDDGAGIRKDEKESRGLTLRLDTKSMTATLVEEYLPHPRLLATSQGSMQMLDDGNVFIGWGEKPYFSEYTAGAKMLYDARLPEDSQSYRSLKYAWVGRPATDPDISASRPAADRIEVAATWNGATEVARWDVLAGRRADRLTRVASARRRGFSTVITAKTRAGFAALEARDAKGAVLGRSKTVRV